jgi:hypothetical protein
MDHIETNFRDNDLNREYIKAINGYKIHTAHTVKRASQIEVGLVSVGFLARIDLALKRC